jgi:hypothetical protein
MKTPSGACRQGSSVGILTIEHMTIKRMEHVGIVVDDLAAATESSSGSDSSCRARGPSKVAR